MFISRPRGDVKRIVREISLVTLLVPRTPSKSMEKEFGAVPLLSAKASVMLGWLLIDVSFRTEFVPSAKIEHAFVPPKAAVQSQSLVVSILKPRH